MPWYVLYTKPRNEKKTAKLLQDKGIVVYCPVTETVKQWSDRRKKIQEPLFHSYIFVCFENYAKEQLTVLNTPGAVRFLWWLKKPAIVRDEEIEGIRQFLEDYRGVSVIVNMNEGEQVTIIEGPLKEQEGKIIKIKGNRAILELQSLGWKVVAELPIQSLKKN